MQFTARHLQRGRPLCAFDDISLKEQEELRALWDVSRRKRREGGCTNSSGVSQARTLAPLSCHVDGRAEI